ncbi:AraC family transcriptional regulator [Kaistia sp. 32K]|uniref:helix-turn-helix domain-containing protein n=1 Tax=Kaistia sp. 32K TaxID=2795690 RepID=UPI001937714B|nr:AraC family transcriptional regulator [Kaistia sp. 32K]BCP52410.1 AraC family transcriptional regulator [Kaistia sp. 32K]
MFGRYPESAGLAPLVQEPSEGGARTRQRQFSDGKAPFGAVLHGAVMREVGVALNINVSTVDIATVPINLPRYTDRKLAVRALACSQLVAADISYGFKPVETAAAFPSWEDAYSIGVRFNDETSGIFVGGKNYAEPHRRGEAHILYLSGVEHIDFSTPRHTIEILLRRSFLREIADDLEVPDVSYLGHSLFHVSNDPLLRQLALRIYPYFDEPETLEPLFADHLIWGLGIYVCAHYGDLAARRRLVGGLSTWQERLAKDIIETRLVGGLGLAEVAALCGLRTSQFAHAFKRSTGVAPYQWLLLRRLARARELFTNHHISLADIAMMCGFADQAHLTRMFSRHLGITPARYRLALQ